MIRVHEGEEGRGTQRVRYVYKVNYWLSSSFSYVHHGYLVSVFITLIIAVCTLPGVKSKNSTSLGKTLNPNSNTEEEAGLFVPLFVPLSEGTIFVTLNSSKSMRKTNDYNIVLFIICSNNEKD